MTEKQYNSHIKKIVDFCAKRNEDTIQATDKTRIEFLTEYYDAGVGYSSVNFERSALSSIIKPVNNVLLAGQHWYVGLWKEYLILDRHYQGMLQLGVWVKFLIVLRANQIYQVVTLKQYHIE